jgi:hypothetical protein
VLYWKALEDEEMRLKKLMLRKSPTGLKTKEIKQVEMAREKITMRHEEKMEEMKNDEAKNIVQRIATIKDRDMLTSSTAKKLEQEELRKPTSETEEKASIVDRSMHEAESSSLPKLSRKAMKVRLH